MYTFKNMIWPLNLRKFIGACSGPLKLYVKSLKLVNWLFFRISSNPLRK